MEKPKNYWNRGTFTIFFNLLHVILFPSPSTYVSSFGGLILTSIVLIMDILCIMQGIRFKDWHYILIGLISFPLFVLVFYFSQDFAF